VTRLVDLARAPLARYTVVAVLAFTLASATVVAAGPVVSGFVGLIDGSNTAAINAGGELSVTDAGANTALSTANAHLANVDTASSRLSFDAAGNLKTASQGAQSVSGTVNVGNFPATQNVSGAVGISAGANTVKIDPANNGRTIVVLSDADSGGTVVPATGITQVMDVSPYGRIRVAVANICTSPTSVLVTLRGNDGVGWVVDAYTLSPCDIKDKNYDLPGASLALQIGATGGATTDRIFAQVFGR